MNDLFDTPAFKLVKRDDPSTSHDAAEQLDVNKMEMLVYKTIQSFGTEGCISDDVCDLLSHKRYSTVTARYKQLKEKGLVSIDHRKRKASSGRQQHIMWATTHYEPEVQDE
jgi:predicted transcriptional regulator